MEPYYLEIVSHYERCLSQFGDTHRGVDWPNLRDAENRYQVMLDVIRKHHSQSPRLLDFGCGAAHLYDYMVRNGICDRVSYSGLDLSPQFTKLCRVKYPKIPFYCLDLMTDPDLLPAHDYVIMNGVFTEKCTLTHERMLEYCFALISAVFEKTTFGLAFNVMSKQVDWERSDLFHLSFDTLANFLTEKVSRHFVIRHDYRLFEYTVYVYR